MNKKAAHNKRYHMTDQRHEPASTRHNTEKAYANRDFVYRVAIVFGIGTLFLLIIGTIWLAGHILLVIFAGILLAVLLNGTSNRLARWLPLSRNQSLFVVLLLMVIFLGTAGYFLAPRVAEQIDPLINTLPSSIKRLRLHLEQYTWLREILQTVPPPGEIISNASGMLTQARAVFSGTFGAIANFVIILFVGIYLAAQPHIYINGFIKLVPKRSRPRGREIFKELGLTLELWLMGKMISMVVVGVATAIGLSLLGVPLAITLGVIAGLLDFIPYLGPVMAGVPAILMAFSESPTTALYVFFLFILIQSGESYLLTPMVDREMVSLPPALTVTMQMLFAVPFGLLGVALASPMSAVLLVLITMLYVQDVLDDPVETPSEHHEH